MGPTYAAQITSRGIEEAERLREEEQAATRVFENVETMLGGDLPDRHERLRKDISNKFAELGAGGNRFSSAAIESAEELGQQQIRHVGRAIIDSWTRALRSFSTPLDPEAVLEEAVARLEAESRQIADAVNTMTEGTRRGSKEIDLLPATKKTRKKVMAELELALAARDKEPTMLDEARDTPDPDRVFVVHGHDEGARESVARFIERLGLKAIILHEQPNKGQTILGANLASVRLGCVHDDHAGVGHDEGGFLAGILALGATPLSPSMYPRTCGVVPLLDVARVDSRARPLNRR